MTQQSLSERRAGWPRRVAASGFRVLAVLLVAGGVLGALGGALLYLAPLTILTRSLDLPPQVGALYGTLRQGRAELTSGHVLSWQTRPGLGPWPGLTGPLRVEGADSALDGRLRLHWRNIGVEGWAGRAGPTLAGLVPGAWGCDMAADLRDVTLLWRGNAAQAAGRILLPGGTCTKGRSEIALPAQRILLESAGDAAMARLFAEGAAPLATLRVGGDRRAELTIAPAAAEVYPALPRGGPIALQYGF